MRLEGGVGSDGASVGVHASPARPVISKVSPSVDSLHQPLIATLQGYLAREEPRSHPRTRAAGLRLLHGPGGGAPLHKRGNLV